VGKGEGGVGWGKGIGGGGKMLVGSRRGGVCGWVDCFVLRVVVVAC